MKKTTAALLISSLSAMSALTTQAKASEPIFDDFRPVINGVSYHLADRDKYNAFNFGGGINAYLTPTAYMSIGAYHNSEYNTSFYGGFGDKVQLTKNFALGFDVLAVSGYERGAFVAMIPNAWLGPVKMLIMPAFMGNPVATLGFQLELR